MSALSNPAKRARAVALTAHALLFVSALATQIGIRCAFSHAYAQDAKAVFYVYQDADSPDNHYRPTGYMGDCGDIQINEAYEDNTHSGKTCIRILYIAKGKGPNRCDYSPPCKWAGVYWQEPPNNWGTDERLKGKGFNLSGYKSLVFWARADKKCSIEFKVGGISQRYGDSLLFSRTTIANLSGEWQQFRADLDGADLSHIIGGFCWVASQDNNPGGATFYLDDIRFERK